MSLIKRIARNANSIFKKPVLFPQGDRIFIFPGISSKLVIRKYKKMDQV